MRGEFVVLLGASGSGKSTLLNILGGLDSASAGTARWVHAGESHELTGASDAELTRYRREHVGFVFQFYNLIPSLTALENVALVTDLADDPMPPEEALALVGLGERMNHFVSQLSGGEQQRVAIARAIAKRPAVLLCDEPTGALDCATGVMVLQAIEHVNRTLGTTTVVITHNAPIADMADRVLRLADGRIVDTRVNAAQGGRVHPEVVRPTMKALDTKLWRDLQRLRAQVVTIAMVVAIGVAGFVGMFSVHESLQGSRDSFYRDNRLADVFASVKRAPVHLGARLAAIPGVAEVKLDVVMDAQIALPDADAPVTGRFIGLDLARVHAQRQGLNALTLRSGRWPERGRALEAVVSDRFAVARGLKPGDRVNAILNGRLEPVHLVGTAISPEYVFASHGGAPDDQTFGIWWIDHERMAHAFDLQGAFNQAALRLDAGASSPP